ncbi:MAG TPA: tyrosine-type recombinase/integrase [Armatimonadetes bacterium]|nr:tyrosine-type recombinase/integrase [Armatimonadota bacterium]HOJ22702.1 tyrosine-type recombinase/integrase [Armatimonadota bacterium]
MAKRQHHFSATEGALSVKECGHLAEGWFADGEMRQLSEYTLVARRSTLRKLIWFLEQQGAETVGTNEIRAFLSYVANGHKQDGGRWGNTETRAKRAVRPTTVHTYFAILRSFFAFVVEEGALPVSPIAGIKPPVARADQVQPFTPEQVSALLGAAKKSKNGKRDEALLLFLLDTGARASEVCALKREDLDLTNRRCQVIGKGNKRRTIFFGTSTKQALWRYIGEQKHAAGDPLFIGDRGLCQGEALQRCGLLKLIHRLGSAAGVDAVRCSPHTFRHTFAVEFLRAGGNTFTLQQLLGHTSLAMTNRYVALAQADLEAQHRAFSPADRLRGAKGKGR